MSYSHFNVPIFKKTYDLYRLIHIYGSAIPRMNRYSLWQKCETHCLEMLEALLKTKTKTDAEKLPMFNDLGVKIDILRFLFRLAYEIKSVDGKKYLNLQEAVDEIGRMLGGWMKNVQKKQVLP